MTAGGGGIEVRRMAPDNDGLEHPPNHLLAKIPNPEALKGGPDPVILMRVEQAIARERNAYIADMSKDVQKLVDMLRAQAAPGDIWPLAHELRCMAGTFAFPFLTQVAQVLCTLVKKYQTYSQLPGDIAAIFADALVSARTHKGAVEPKQEAVISGLRKIAARHVNAF